MSAVKSHTIPFEGGEVYYEDRGNNPSTLVFVHGWCCSTQIWRHQLSLDHKYRLILLDLPGHGKSSASADETYSLESFANAVHAVLQHAGVQAATLVGFSLGGPVCTMLLRLHPGFVKAVLYVDTFFAPPGAYETKQQRRQTNLMYADDASFEQFLSSIFFQTHTPKDIQDEVLQMMVRDTSKVTRMGCMEESFNAHAMRAEETFPAMPALHIQTKVELCPFDPNWSRLLPRLKSSSDGWDGHGHFLFLEAPDRFNAQLIEFQDGVALAEKETPA